MASKNKKTETDSANPTPTKDDSILEEQGRLEKVTHWIKGNKVITIILCVLLVTCTLLAFTQKAGPSTSSDMITLLKEILTETREARSDIRNRVPNMRPTGGIPSGMAPTRTSGLPNDVTETLTEETEEPETPPVDPVTLTRLIDRTMGRKEIHVDAGGRKIDYYDCVDVAVWPGEQLLATRKPDEFISFHHIPGSGEEYFVQYERPDGTLSDKFTFGDNGIEVFDDGARTAIKFIVSSKMDGAVTVGIKYLADD